MKTINKILFIGASVLCGLTFVVACDQPGSNSTPTDSASAVLPSTDSSSTGGSEHQHALTHVDAVAATCTEAGNIEYWVCEECSSYFADANATDSITIDNTVVAATGHKEVVDAAVAATCTEKGKTEGKHCEVCGTVIVAQEEVAALGHTESEWIVTEDGTRKYVECTVCHIELKSENIETSEKPSEEPSTEPSETPSEEPSTEPQVPTDTPEKGCKGSTIGIISIASLLGLLFLKKKQK